MPKPQPLLESISFQRHPRLRRRPDPEGGQRIPGLSKLWPKGEKQTFFSCCIPQPPPNCFQWDFNRQIYNQVARRIEGGKKKVKKSVILSPAAPPLARSLISAVLFWFAQIFPKGCEEQLLYLSPSPGRRLKRSIERAAESRNQSAANDVKNAPVWRARATSA